MTVVHLSHLKECLYEYQRLAAPRRRTALTESGCPDPAIDARWMAEDVLRMTRTDLKFEGDREVTPGAMDRLNAMLARRAAGEPVQYILESADFMGLRFYVDKRVLIPRQDTETLVENALIAVTQLGDPAVLDLCTGSGCVGLSLKNLAPRASVTLTDISRDALEVAGRTPSCWRWTRRSATATCTRPSGGSASI